jgi:hypothetical protein
MVGEISGISVAKARVGSTRVMLEKLLYGAYRQNQVPVRKGEGKW